MPADRRPGRIARFYLSLASSIGLLHAGRVHAATEDPPATLTHATLPALIDLAEQANPETRGAWNEALAAAAAAGVARSAYLPTLAIQALAGAQRTPLAAPSSMVPKGYFISDTREVVPILTAQWLLFDFGLRDANLAQANATTFVAQASFNATHQKLIYTISHDYYALGAQAGKLVAARQALATATIDNDAVAARRGHGLATTVDTARSERQLAQARYALVKAQGAVDTARATLVGDIGLPAGTPIGIAPVAEAALPLPPAENVAGYVARALDARPDISAARGKIDAADAALRAADAAFLPTLALTGQALFNDSRLRSDGGPWSNVHRPGGSLMLQFSWDLFDGGARRSRVAAARAERDAAQDALQHARDTAGKEVTQAFSALQTALASASAAREVTHAAVVSHDAALVAFRQGLATFDDLASEANALSAAQADEEDARADAFTAAAALAFATGQPAR